MGMSREEAIEVIKSECYVFNPLNFDRSTRINTALDMAVKALEQEPKTGHWIFDEILDRNYYCSECKSMGVDYWDYCPYCGAKMIEPQESEDKE